MSTRNPCRAINRKKVRTQPGSGGDLDGYELVGGGPEGLLSKPEQENRCQVLHVEPSGRRLNMQHLALEPLSPSSPEPGGQNLSLLPPGSCRLPPKRLATTAAQVPGLHLHRSNHLPLLAELLAQNMVQAPLSDPFAPEWVVIGNKGLEAWLVRSLAQRIGICAQVEFPFALGFLERAAASLEAAASGQHRPFGLEPPASGWSVDAITWAVLEMLPQLSEDPQHRAIFAPVRAWVAADDDRSWTGRRAYGLARRIAEVFDRVLVFRPELARAWSAGLPGPGLLPADLAWQPVLWHAVQLRLGPDACHLADRLSRLPGWLAAGPLPDDFPRRVNVFGLSTLAPVLLSAFADLSALIDVDLLLLSPSEGYWERVRRGRGLAESEEADAVPNLLLGAFGRLFRDFQEQLLELPQQLDDHTERSEIDLYIDPAKMGAPSALRALRSDAVRLEQGRHALPLLQIGPDGPVARDASLQVHACHGPTRQVEVLRDVLLGLLEDDPTLQPRDILVLAPEMESWAPLVAAVFDQGGEEAGPQGPPRIPVRIEDLSFRRTNPVATALLALLALVEGRMPASAVLDLLSLEPVRLAFGIDPDELPDVQALFERAGVRWGSDAAGRAAHDQPEDDAHTWRFGLERLALGVAMADDWCHFAGRVPLDDAEGGAVSLVGRALRFGAVILEEVERLSAPRPLSAWVAALLGTGDAPGTLDRLVAAPDRASWLVERTRREVEQVGIHGESAGVGLDLDLPTLRAHLEGRFEVAAPNPRTPGGAVAFAALRPMRGVPHRVICLLGMDEGAFPRSRPDLRFDPCNRSPRVGDRDPRDEDRAAFLEAVLAAQDHLVLLYSGRNPRSDAACPPCGPLAELLDIVDRSFEPLHWAGREQAPTACLTQHHPLQGFSPQAFTPVMLPPLGQVGLRAWSFDPGLEGAARQLARSSEGLRVAPVFLPLDEALPADPDAESGGPALALDSLAAFWKRPVRYLLENRVGLRLRDDAHAVPDREPLELHGLERWSVDQSLLEAADAGLEPALAQSVLLGRGALPLGLAGRRTIAQRADVVQRALDLESSLRGSRPGEAFNLDLALGGLRLVGRLEDCVQEPGPDGPWQRCVLRVVGRQTERRLLGPWLHLLAWTVATGGACCRVQVVFVADEPAVTSLGMPQGSPEERLAAASAELLRRIAGWKAGRVRPLPLYERCSHAFATAALKQVADADALLAPEAEEAREAAVKAASDSWCGNGSGRGLIEGADLLLQRVFGPVGARWSRRPWQRPDGGLDEAFARAALDHWLPILQAIQPVEAA